ncbi:unnamed protein product [Cylicocyclus nassatus]|uniref:Uncharacterized protein n=1 Tax=Cylicocyclus nassatus TaxID=53992 RepID=A0AA36GSY5_CYLNA|nr:unnamed protein product [Cylicocyclus nassatus]
MTLVVTGQTSKHCPPKLHSSNIPDPCFVTNPGLRRHLDLFRAFALQIHGPPMAFAGGPKLGWASQESPRLLRGSTTPLKLPSRTLCGRLLNTALAVPSRGFDFQRRSKSLREFLPVYRGMLATLCALKTSLNIVNMSVTGFPAPTPSLCSIFITDMDSMIVDPWEDSADDGRDDLGEAWYGSDSGPTLVRSAWYP